MKRTPSPGRPIPHNFKRPHSKAEEPDCLSRRNPPSIIITTQSLRIEGNTILLFDHGDTVLLKIGHVENSSELNSFESFDRLLQPFLINSDGHSDIAFPFLPKTISWGSNDPSLFK